MRIQLALLLLFLTAVFGCRNNQEKQVVPPTAIDTTITLENAFTRLVLDSQIVHKYVVDHPEMSDTSKQLIVNFYNSRNFQYAWFDEKGRTEHAGMIWNLYRQYVEYTGDSAKANQFLSDQMQRLIEGDTTIDLDPINIRRSELALTHLFFDYAFAAYAGSLKPEELQWHIPRRKMDIAGLLDSLLTKKGLSADEWEPVHRQYYLLRNELIKLNALHRKGGWPWIDTSTNRKLKEGMKDSLVIQIKRRLQFTGNYPVSDTSATFNETLTDTIKKIQVNYGLAASGMVTRALIDALNLPVSERIKQLIINLERVRWLPRRPEGDWIMVNIPSFTLQAYERDSIALEMKVVVGAAATRTVIFSDEMQHIVFSPYWNIPASIVRNEILPSMKKRRNYLEKMRMEKIGTHNGVPLIRQKPGKGNALGRVKFIFPNSYNIYLHDTPAKSYFEENSRAFSHGCIRVSEPFELAKYLLRKDSSWTDIKIKDAMNAEKEKWVGLKNAVPVFITYFTAWVDNAGALQLRDDIYGHDANMAEHLFR